MPKRMISRFRGSPYAFPLAAITALAMFFISESSYQQASGSLDALGRMALARTTIQTLWRDLTDAETGQRGFLLTGRKEYLEPYTRGAADSAVAIASLSDHYRNDPVGTALMDDVRKLAGEKLSELSTTLRLYEEGREEAWRGVLLTNFGKEKMDAVRVNIDKLLKLESGKVDIERRGVYQTLLINRIGVTAMTALSLLALFMYLRQTAALEAHRADRQRAVQADRDRLEAEVERRTAQLTELAQHLQTVREDERSRLARELHDELGALLTAAKLDVARLKSRLGSITPEATERLAHLNEALNSGIALKRRIIEDLRPSSLSNLGLVAALDILTHEFGTRSELKVTTDLETVSLAPSGELTVYRLVQEALTNVAKYARATEVHVKLGTTAQRVQVSVQDNGQGFDQSEPRTSAHGLLGMRYRVEAEGGRMRLVSAPGKGTLIAATLPMAEPVAPRDGDVGDLAHDDAASGLPLSAASYSK
ncbi:hypothetical protein BH11PSE8_BH11PSE8_03760 [soil metagenome]